jgi:hypothetical protein
MRHRPHDAEYDHRAEQGEPDSTRNLAHVVQCQRDGGVNPIHDDRGKPQEAWCKKPESNPAQHRVFAFRLQMVHFR